MSRYYGRDLFTIEESNEQWALGRGWDIVNHTEEKLSLKTYGYYVVGGEKCYDKSLLEGEAVEMNNGKGWVKGTIENKRCSYHQGGRNPHHQAEELGYAPDFLLFEAEIDVEHVGHHPHDDIGDAVSGNQGEDQQRCLAIAPEKIPKRPQIGFGNDFAGYELHRYQQVPHSRRRANGCAEPYRFDQKPGQA